jgi:hypothetical protein
MYSRLDVSMYYMVGLKMNMNIKTELVLHVSCERRA